jgi:RNA polymerase sigma factor (sigma-70 family)
VTRFEATEVLQVINAEGPGEHAATVSRLFRNHNRMLVEFLYAHLKNTHEAKEIAQEAYMKLLQLDDRSATSFLQAYLFRIAKNLALDHLRQRRSRRRLDQLNSANNNRFSDLGPERTAIARQELALLARAVAELPPKCQEAFRLHKLEDRPLSDVAAQMGISERMVRKHVRRALIYAGLRRDGLSAADASEELNIA